MSRTKNEKDFSKSQKIKPLLFDVEALFCKIGFIDADKSIFEQFIVSEIHENYSTNTPKVFVAGDARCGQSLVIWAIREGRKAAETIDEQLSV